MSTILVTGGAGYIGSHVVQALAEQGFHPVTYDNLQQGHRQAVKAGDFVKADLLDSGQLNKTFGKYRFDAVIHLAASISVGESVASPAKYFRNNFYAGIQLVRAMLKHKVNKLIFSSTAAVYAGRKSPLKENHPVAPASPYGSSKLMFEMALEEYSRLRKFNYIALRYFNAAGAHHSSQIGEDHKSETHLIPLVLKTALEQFPYLKIFGNDYPTKDGTCIRDYIHVSDIAQAHILALECLRSKPKNHVYNLGNGKGFSVREIIKTSEKITGKHIKTKNIARRAGDQNMLVADASLIKKELGWSPQYKTIESIIESAWRWHSSHPRGY